LATCLRFYCLLNLFLYLFIIETASVCWSRSLTSIHLLRCHFKLLFLAYPSLLSRQSFDWRMCMWVYIKRAKLLSTIMMTSEDWIRLKYVSWIGMSHKFAACCWSLRRLLVDVLSCLHSLHEIIYISCTGASLSI
jgi:hypothetical protein